MGKVTLAAVAALDLKDGIGRQGRLLIECKEDMRRFKALTTGNAVLMGRKTFESIGRPLPNRTNLVMTYNLDFHPEGAQVINSEAALRSLIKGQEQEPFDMTIYLIGGGVLYKTLLPLCEEMYITRYNMEALADTYFPHINEEDWDIISKEHFKDRPPLEMDFIHYVRKNRR